jgi:hypothetical protein
MNERRILAVLMVGFLTACTQIEDLAQEDGGGIGGPDTSLSDSAPGETSSADDGTVPDGALDVTLAGDISIDGTFIDGTFIDVPAEDGTDAEVGDPEDVPPGCENGGCFGDPCDEPNDCLSGLCLPHMGDEVCSEICDSECPAGFTCDLLVMGGGDPVMICLSTLPHLCLPCGDAGDCDAGGVQSACIVYGDQGSFCGGNCGDDDDCPVAFTCELATATSGGSSSQCVSMTGECPCAEKAVDLALSTPCAITNEAGSCEGIRVCSVDGLSACDAPLPQFEICDGEDNDCTGGVDELVSCDDGDPCTTDSCEGTEGCVYVDAPGAPCDDGDPATAGDLCGAGGQCAGTPFECPAGPCIVSSTPVDGNCITTYEPPGASCDDGNPSTENDVCDGAGSCAGSAFGCPGPTLCTPSYVQDGDGCVPVHADQSTFCNDGDNTTKNDICDGAGNCVGGPYGCPAATDCTPSYVQDGAGCLPNHAPQGTGCNDGTAATKDDVCVGAGICAGTPYTCPAATFCIPSYSQNGTDCGANYAPPATLCDDGDKGTQNDVCDGIGTCAGSPFDCPGGTVCTPSYTQDEDQCVANYAPGGTDCNDGDNSTQSDVCNGAGICAGSSYSCPQPSTCTPSYTQDGSGCFPNHAGPGTACNDGSNSTQVDVCNGAGGCAGVPYSCPGPTVCTPSYIQDGNGCTPNHAGAGAGCNDGSNSTNNDVCNGAGGCSGTPYGCPGGTTCTPSYTQDGSGCAPNHAGVGTGCNDGSNSTNNDTCNGAGGCSGTPYACPGGTACTPSYTQDGSGCVPSHAGAGTKCDDGNNSTSNDVCDGSGGCAGESAVCGNGIVEAGEACDGGTCCTGSCTNVPNGTYCGKPEPWACWINTCKDGSCSVLADECAWNEHCCEFGCLPNNMQCP